MLLDKVKRAIAGYNMLCQNDKVTVCLSGGADSVALLLALLELKNEYNLTITALHINHLLRGEDSDCDEQFCINLCDRLGVPIISERHKVADYARTCSLSIEEAARNIRYKAISEHTKGIKAATAHTASDNAETVIHNFTRGTGLKGLTGIPKVRENIIRPLILCNRSEIEQYLSEKSQDFVTDKTNFSLDYTRNKIRHEVIPTLVSINPSFYNTVSQGIETIELENSYFEEMANSAYEKSSTSPLHLTGLSDFHKAIRHRCIVSLLKMAEISYNHERVNQIDDIVLNSGKINLSGDIYVISAKNSLWIEKITPKVCENTEQELVLGINNFKGIKTVIVEEIIEKNTKIRFVNKLLTNHYIDCDKIEGQIVLRNRRCGDKIHLAGRKHTTTVKKLFNSEIPLEKRDDVCILADSSGVIFIEGYGCAEKVKADDTSKKIIKIDIGTEICQ